MKVTEVCFQLRWLRRPRLGPGWLRCANAPCRAMLVNAERIGVLAAGTDEIPLCPPCARRLAEQAESAMPGEAMSSA